MYVYIYMYVCIYIYIYIYQGAAALRRGGVPASGRLSLGWCNVTYL